MQDIPGTVERMLAAPPPPATPSNYRETLKLKAQEARNNSNISSILRGAFGQFAPGHQNLIIKDWKKSANIDEINLLHVLLDKLQIGSGQEQGNDSVLRRASAIICNAVNEVKIPPYQSNYAPYWEQKIESFRDTQHNPNAVNRIIYNLQHDWKTTSQKDFIGLDNSHTADLCVISALTCGDIQSAVNMMTSLEIKGNPKATENFKKAYDRLVEKGILQEIYQLYPANLQARMTEIFAKAGKSITTAS